VADTTARTLRLLSLLQTHRFWAGPELCDRLEVSARTLRRDIDRLRSLGYHVDATPGVAGGYRLATGSHLPPLVLDDDEAVAITLGVQAAATAAVAGVEDAALQALTKLQQVLPDRLRRRVAALHGSVSVLGRGDAEPVVDPDALMVLAQACRDGEEVRFDYARRDGERASRLVQPHQLVSVGRRWYLVAWDVRRDDWRTFRLDRLEAARLAGARFAARAVPGGDAAAFVAASLRSMPVAHEVLVDVDAPASELAEVARWLGSEVVVLPDGWCRVKLRSDWLDPVVSMVATLAARHDVRVAASGDVMAALAATARRLATATVGTGDGVRRSDAGKAAVT
jgi:predicted DNA-binding transcriptional regulator YafY